MCVCVVVDDDAACYMAALLFSRLCVCIALDYYYRYCQWERVNMEEGQLNGKY